MVTRTLVNGVRLYQSLSFSALHRLRVHAPRFASTESPNTTDTSSENKHQSSDNGDLGTGSEEATKKKPKTQAEADEELRQKLEGISGGGGEAGLELENGQPVAMKRSVKNNMFRYI